ASGHLAMEYSKSLREAVDDFPYNPEGMYYFYDRLKAFIDPENRELADKKVIATMCIYVPDEIIYALEAFPLRICSGSYTHDQVGAEFMPAKACSLVKSTVGNIHLEQFPMGAKPLLLVNPTSCDQKKKLAEIETSSVIPFYTLEVPPSKDSDAARTYWAHVMGEFILKLEKVTGNKLTRKKLKDAILLIARAQEEYRKLYNLRMKFPLIWGKDVIILTNTYFFEDIKVWTAKLAELNRELEERLAKKQFVVNEIAPRVILTGSPSIFPNIKLPAMVEQLGALVVADDFCSSSRLLYDTVAVDEWFLYDMIPALADRYLKPCTCPNLTPNTDRDRKLIKTVKESNADGVIYQAFAGCHLYEMESLRISRMLEAEGIPMLYVETDYNPDDTGQLSTRLEAFLESIKNKKRHKVKA
ncbi:2-hydroxyacyl-CoA dehydratase, partial [Bacteroidota bacterium]